MTEELLTRAIIATDSMITLLKVERQMLYADLIELTREGGIEMLKWIFFPGHAGDRH